MGNHTTHSFLQLDQLENLLERHLAMPKQQRDIAGLLADIVGPERRTFIEELVAMDVELRQQEGDAPKLSDYLIFDDEENDYVKSFFSNVCSENSSQFDEVLRENRPKLPERYEQREQIGQGGVGEVWRVFDRQIQRPLALKVLRDRYRNSRQANMRMQREAMLTGSLQHPGIPPVHDAGTLSDGSHFFAMKLIDGRTLERSNSDSKSLESIPNELGVFLTVAQAVSFAHSQGIIHRDLKPQNIMVGKFGEVQVMDWGMAKRFNIAPDPAISTANQLPEDPIARNETLSRSNDSSIKSQPCQTMVGDIIGTPRYMAPEQARGELNQLDPRTDVFSLGALLFEILTNSRMHNDDSSPAILKKTATNNLSEALKPLQDCEADESLIDLCKRCLSPKMEDRPCDAGAVADSISEYLTTAQQRARTAEIELRESEVRLQEQTKRRRTFNRMLTAIAIAVSLGVAGIVWQWDIARKSAARTEGILDIVTGSFRSILPTVGGTSNMPAKQVVINAKSKLEDSDLDDEGAMILLENLTRCFLDLGEFESAKETAEQGLELCEQQLGNEDSRTVTMNHLLGHALLRLGEQEAAIAILTDAAAKFEALGGSEHEDTLSTELTLAGSYFRNGDIDESISRYADLQKRYQKKLGKTSREHLSVVTNLLGVFHSTKKYDEAAILGEEYLPVAQQTLGDDHPDYLMMAANLGSVYYGQKEYVKAADLYEKTNEAMKVKLGNHPMRLSIVSNLAIVYSELGREDESIDILKESIPLLEAKVGAEHPSVWRSRISLAQSLREAKRYEESEEMYLQTIEVMERSLGPSNQYTLMAQNSYGYLFLESEQFSKAATQFQIVYEEKKKKKGAEHPDTIAALNMVVWALALSDADGGKVSEALLEEFRTGCELTKDHNHFNTLATAEYRRGNYQLSISAVEQAISLEAKPSSGLAAFASGLFGGSTSTQELHPSNFALLAMCHYKLGEDEAAKQQEEKFKNALESATEDIKNECEFFTQQLASLSQSHSNAE